MRIGIVGVENSHVDHIIAALNAEDDDPDARVVALAAPDDERTAALLASGGIEHRVDEVDDLLPLADVLVVSDRHGGRHLAHALPFLETGRPVYVDKPLACSVEDARAMTAAAAESGALLTSYSTMRWVPELTGLVDRLPSLGALRVVTTTGSAATDSEHGGIFFYGIHAVDVALRLAPGAVDDVRVERLDGAVVLTLMAGGTWVSANLVQRDETGAVPFHALAVGRHGVAAAGLSTAGNYVRPALQAFLDMVRSGRPPISDDDLLRPIEVLAEAQRQLGRTA